MGRISKIYLVKILDNALEHHNSPLVCWFTCILAGDSLWNRPFSHI